MADQRIFRQDNTSAFNENWLEIDAEIPTGWTISRADVKITSLPVKSYDNPTFPFYVNLTEDETALLKDTEQVSLAVYDSQGRKRTCDGILTFRTRRRMV